MKRCVNCGAKLGHKDEFCPECGAEQPKGTILSKEQIADAFVQFKLSAIRLFRKASKWAMIVAAVVVIAFIAIFAVRRHNAPLQYERGQAYLNGNETTQDYKKAVKALNYAYSNGVKEAAFPLATCYANGYGIKRDMVRAVELYRAAAKRKDVDAQFALAQCYEVGNGAEQNEAAAFDWYTKAAKNGNVDAMLTLAKYYANGTLVETDEKESLKWYKRAADGGSNEAKAVLQAMQEKDKSAKDKEAADKAAAKQAKAAGKKQ